MLINSTSRSCYKVCALAVLEYPQFCPPINTPTVAPTNTKPPLCAGEDGVQCFTLHTNRFSMLVLATVCVVLIDLMTWFHLFLDRIDHLEIKGCVCVARTILFFLSKLHFPPVFFFALSRRVFGKYVDQHCKYERRHPFIRSLRPCMG